MSKKDINPVDASMRHMIEFHSKNNKMTIAAYLKDLFPRSFPAVKGIAEEVTARADAIEAEYAEPDPAPETTVAEGKAQAEADLMGTEPKPVPGPDSTEDLLGTAPVAEAVEEVEEVTLDKVRHIMTQAIRISNAGVVKKILGDHGATRLSELNEGSYASVVDVCEELIREKA